MHYLLEKKSLKWLKALAEEYEELIMEMKERYRTLKLRRHKNLLSRRIEGRQLILKEITTAINEKDFQKTNEPDTEQGPASAGHRNQPGLGVKADEEKENP